MYVLVVSPTIAVPPVATVNQRYCPLVPPEAIKLIEAEGPQAEAGVAVGEVGSGFIVAMTAVLTLSHVPLSMDT